MSPAAVRPSVSPHARARRAHAGGLALLISVAVHALAAASAGVVLPRMLTESAPPVPVEIELAHVDRAVPEAPPAAASPAPPPPRQFRSRVVKAPRRASPSPTSPVVAPVPAPSSPGFAPPANEAAPLHFSLSDDQASLRVVATSTGPSDRRAPAAACAPGADSGAVIAESEVNVPAHMLATSPVDYPAQARQAEVEADVLLEIVVGTDGRVLSARSLKRRGYGLDEAAERALLLYRFSPALRDGHPVRVRMRWPVQFRLR